MEEATSIKLVEKNLMEGRILPMGAVQDRAVLAGYYSFYSQQLEDILMRKPSLWLHLRQQHKSDKATDRAYELTEDGLNELGLSMRMKRIEKMMSALKTIIDTANVQYQHS
jgi:hypothetical protein